MTQNADDSTAVECLLSSNEDGEYKKDSQLSIDSAGPFCTPLANRSAVGTPIDNRKEEKVKTRKNQRFDLTRDVPRERGRKKAGQSINHLLNFTISSEDYPTDTHGHHRRNPKYRVSTFNKEQYLQANCQFLVRADGDYALHNIDPDVLVQWDNIEQVRLWCHELPSCPICLYPPTAAKITRCGHIFCWPCILHYLSLTEKSWKKCPLCQEAVHQVDLKSVISIAKHRYALGEDITLCLMRRRKDSTMVQIASELDDVLRTSYIEDYRETFSKLILITTDQVIKRIIQEEERILRETLGSTVCLEVEELTYINRALDLLQVRKKQLTEIDSICVDEVEHSKNTSLNTQDAKSTHTNASAAKVNHQDVLQRISDEPNDIGSAVSSDKLAMAQPPYEPPDNSYYLYQAKDGQHIYLHTFNAKCLIKEYGSLKNAPRMLTARIVDIEQFSVTEEFRSRNRYLRHLPLTCMVYICELDLRQPTLSRPILQTFSREIRQRKERRRKKLLAEKRCFTNKLKDKTVPPPNTLESFPSMGFVLTGATATLSISTEPVEEPAPEESIDSQSSSCYDAKNIGSESESCRNLDVQPSFAQALLSNVKSSGNDLSSANVPEFKDALRKNEKIPFKLNDDSDNDINPIPSYRESFMNSLSNNWGVNRELRPLEDSLKITGKKKKGGKKLLFSNSNHLRYS
ncbi:RING finger protein 10 [Trichoplax sp. H2]|nr:RING finger protein 10 [Trichoplax sp. H2]|eukprot:RDD47305.1 RING finger protein 10 [Trichoplax sp. H2]